MTFSTIILEEIKVSENSLSLNLPFHYCICVHSAWKGRPRNDLYCVWRDVKPYPTWLVAWRSW